MLMPKVLSKDKSSAVPAMSLAVRLALLDTRLPRTMPADSEEGLEAGDFDVDDDYSNARPLEEATNFPLLTIVNYVGPHILFDASEEEEAVMTGRALIGVLESGKIALVRHLDVAEAREGIQGRSDQRGLSVADVRRGAQEAVDVSLSVYKAVRTHIEEPSNLFEVL